MDINKEKEKRDHYKDIENQALDTNSSHPLMRLLATLMRKHSREGIPPTKVTVEEVQRARGGAATEAKG